MTELVTALPKAGDILDGMYRIERLLGRGQTSATFGAVRIDTVKRCAVRCWLALEAGSAAAASREFARVSRESGILAHPSIVEVFSVGEIEGLHYAVMEWLDGVSLPVYLEQHPGAFTLEETLALLLPCIDGLAEAHAAGVVHGDVRTENIFVCAPTDLEPARTRILHFGFSGSEGQPLVLPRPLSGNSRQFLSPEELRGDPLDERSDIYALGVLFYVLLSGQYPFRAETMNDLGLEIVAGAWTPISEHVPRLAVGMEWVVEHAMATEPDERYQNMDELMRDLARFDSRVSLGQLASVRSRLQLPAAITVPNIRLNAAVLEQARRANSRRNFVSRAGVLIGILFAALLVRVLTASERTLPRAAASTPAEMPAMEIEPAAKPAATAASLRDPAPAAAVANDKASKPLARRRAAGGSAAVRGAQLSSETAVHAALAGEPRRRPALGGQPESRTLAAGGPTGNVNEPQILGTREALPTPTAETSAQAEERPRAVPPHDPLESMRLQ